ncbi:hypothetical protein WJX82_008581 [Trebouxia sp. C0006]
MGLQVHMYDTCLSGKQCSSRKNSPDSVPLSSASHMTSTSSEQQSKASRPRARAIGERRDKSKRRRNRQQKGLDPASVCKALVALGKAGKADEAESLWNKCEANGMLADEKLVGTLCANFAEAAEPEKIKIAISKGKHAGLFPIPSAYSSLIKAYGQCQQWRQVREVLIEMIQSRVPINRLHYMSALRSYHRNNQCQEAEWLLNEMISQKCELIL